MQPLAYGFAFLIFLLNYAHLQEMIFQISGDINVHIMIAWHYSRMAIVINYTIEQLNIIVSNNIITDT